MKTQKLSSVATIVAAIMILASCTKESLNVVTPQSQMALNAGKVAGAQASLAAPTFSSFGAAAVFPGQNIVINGSNFPTSGLTVTITPDTYNPPNINCSIVSVNSAGTQITITVPSTAYVNYRYSATITTSSGSVSTSPNTYFYVPGPPTMSSSISGNINTLIIVNGTNFDGPVTLTVNGQTVTPYGYYDQLDINGVMAL